MPHPDDVPTPPEAPNVRDGFAWLVQQALFTLTPFFMDGAAGDPANARAAAETLLGSYRIEAPQDLQLATECIVCAYSAMDNLRQAKTDPEMPETRRLRLRSGAASLNRASHRARRALEVLHKHRAPAPEPWEAPSEPSALAARAATELMREIIAQTSQHREHLPVIRTPTAPVPPKFMTREQRRAAKLAARREARRAQDLAYAARLSPA
jgi:hypothetical protein